MSEDTDEIRPADIAAELMLNAAREVERMTIREHLEDHEIDDPGHGITEQVVDLITTASISVEWPETTDGMVNVGDGLVGALVAKLGQERNDAHLALDDARTAAAQLLRMEREHTGTGREGHLSETDLRPLLHALGIDTEEGS